MFNVLMPHWPLFCHVNIAVALAPSLSSIVVVSPTRRPSPSSCPPTVHPCCAPLSITFKPSLHRPLPSIAFALKVCCHCDCVISCRPSPSRSHHAVPCRQVAITPSIAIAPRRPSQLSPCCRPLPSIRLLLLSFHRVVHCCPLPTSPSPLSRHCAIYHHPLPAGVAIPGKEEDNA